MGEVVLGGAGNSYAGGTFINQGSITVASDGLLGDTAGHLAFDGGGLSVGSGFSSARVITLGVDGGTLDTSGTSATFSGTISGPGRSPKALDEHDHYDRRQ